MGAPLVCVLLSSDKLEAPGGKQHHSQKNHTMKPALDVCLAIKPLAVAYQHIHELDIEFVCTEQEIALTERA